MHFIYVRIEERGATSSAATCRVEVEARRMSLAFEGLRLTGRVQGLIFTMGL